MAGFEDILVEKGLLSDAQLGAARERARANRESLVAALVGGQFVDEAELLPVVAERQHMRFVRLSEEAVDDAAVRALTAKLVSHYSVMPIQYDGRSLTVAVSDPFDIAAAEDIETNLGCHVERVLACRSDIREALHRYYGVGAETVERILAESPEREVLHRPQESHDLDQQAEDASVVRLVNQLLHDAIDDRATDIHFEAHRDGVSIRRRIDGVLYDMSVPRNIRHLYPAIISRIKLMSHLDIVERRLPQDGRSRVRIGSSEYDLRVSVVPAAHGEDVVIRILPATMLFDLGDLGFSDHHRALLESYVARPHGILFVTGPTGSGKSTTLYACLSRLNTRSRKIITLEDPVEYELHGITQTQMNPKIGLTFSRALPSMLRHDPDVMMVGEVRDRETAEIAIQTAMTGHLVLSTLHTNDAAGGAVRLGDMGVDPYLIASTVHVFIAQRLVRVICRHCKESYEADGQTLYRGAGCKACNGSGYHGRVAIAEFLPLLPEIQSLILERASAAQLRTAADALDMPTLADDGMAKVAQGVTTIEEVLRVTTL
ncbi:MAG: type II/IV secretion system protein [Verrucomicrobia bacterium]|jgi:general secretion pathway protein E|nr:type II/IV secretion system protein [Verrucomicrobiota bacterium]MBT7066999.1 type II/IV secretion system protein [Verrucomicrobiota bacterium]MBT7701154.1 type II/IV secretion system protein [Verrucomicrobiota bacterium]